MAKVTKISKEALKGSAKKAKTDKATATAVVKKITDRKDLTYNYPKEADSLEKRKAFRAKCRKKVKSLEKNLRLITKGKREGKVKDAEKELAEFKAKNLA